MGEEPTAVLAQFHEVEGLHLPAGRWNPGELSPDRVEGASASQPGRQEGAVDHDFISPDGATQVEYCGEEGLDYGVALLLAGHWVWELVNVDVVVLNDGVEYVVDQEVS